MTDEKISELEQILKNYKTGGCSSPTSHSAIFEQIISLVKPKNILEIGFFTGASATLWLELTKEIGSKLTSVDPFLDNPTNDYLNSVGHPEEIGAVDVQLASVETLKKNYPDRFKFVHKRSISAAIDGDLNSEKFDLAWVDGDHWLAGVLIDLYICLALKIPFLALDDANQEFIGVLQAVSQMKNRFQVLNFWKKENGDGSDILFLANLDVVKLENK